MAYSLSEIFIICYKMLSYLGKIIFIMNILSMLE